MGRIVLPHPPGLWTPRRGSSRIFVKRCHEASVWIERGQWLDRRYFAMLLDSYRFAGVAPNTYYLNTDGSNGDGSIGSPWNSLENARAGLIALFSSFVTSTVTPTLICSGATDDTTAVTNTWPTSNGTYFLTIMVPSGDRKVQWDGNVYTLVRSTNFTPALSINTNTIRLIGVQIQNNANLNVGGNNGISVTGLGGTITLDGVKVRRGPSNVGAIGIAGDQVGTYVLRNCLSLGFFSGVSLFNLGNSTTVLIYNHTVPGSGEAGSFGISVTFTAGGSNKVARVKNVLAQQTANGITITNATTSDTATNHHNTGVDASFVNAAAFDYRLTGSDTVAKDQGTDLSGVADSPFAIDAAQTVRPQGSAWDIGAHEYA